MNNRHVYVLAAVLTVFGLATFLFKVLVIGFPLIPGQTALAWNVEAQITFEASGGPVKVSTYVPRHSHSMAILNLKVIAPGYGLSRSSEAENRIFHLTKRKAQGSQISHLRFVAHKFVGRDTQTIDQTPRVTTPNFDDAKLTAARDLIDTAEAHSSDDETLVTALLKLLEGRNASESASEFVGLKSNLIQKADAAVRLLALKNIAARRVNGIDLQGNRKSVRVVRWLEVFIRDEWRAFSIETGDAEIPKSYLAWWRGSEPMAKVEGGGKPKIDISYTRVEERVLDRILTLGESGQDQFVTFSLFGLPIATQQVYRVLLVVPLGIFVLVVLRNIIGFRSLGTFMPVLIALAFRETQLVWGLILFTTVVGGGLVFRFYLEYLKLLLVPRLASVLIFVIVLMAVLSVGTNKLGFERGLSVALFPMVIMTMTIERVSVIWDERGPAAAITQAIGSLSIATLCYLVMTREVVEHIFFTFPELLLILLATTMLIGRYSGYRLLELKRFRVLAEISK